MPKSDIEKNPDKERAIIIEDGEIVGGTDADKETRQEAEDQGIDPDTGEGLYDGGGGSSGGGGGGSSSPTVEDFNPDDYPFARSVSELGEIRRENYGLTDQEKNRVSRGKDPVPDGGTGYVQYNPEFSGGSGEVLASGDTRAGAAADRLNRELRDARRRGRDLDQVQLNTGNLPFDQELSQVQTERAQQSREQAETIREQAENLPDADRIRLQGNLEEQLGKEVVQRSELENFLNQQAEELQNQASTFQQQAREAEVREIEQERQQEQEDVMGSEPVTGRDGFFTRIDARTANRQQQELDQALTGTRNAAQTISETRPAEFLGRVAAGGESFVKEGLDSITGQQNFDSMTEEQLFSNRAGRTQTTAEQFGSQQDFTDVLEFDPFELDEAQTVEEDRVDQFAADVSRPSAALTQLDDFGDFGVATVARPFTQAAREAEQTVTSRDTGADKVSDFDIAEGTAAFAASTAKQAREDPARFAVNLGIDTLTGTAALKGGRTASKASRRLPDEASRLDPRTGVGRKPRPGEETPSLMDTQIDEINTLRDLIEGDLQKRSRSTEGKEVIITDDPNMPGARRADQDTKEIIFNTREGEDGVVIDPETQDAITTTDISRTDILKNQLKDLEERFLEPNAMGLGPGALVPKQRKRPRDQFGDTSTDVTKPQDRRTDVAGDTQRFFSSDLDRPTTDTTVFNEPSQTGFAGTIQGVETSQSLEDQLSQSQDSLSMQVQDEPIIFDQPQTQSQPQTFEEPQLFETSTTQQADTFTSPEAPQQPQTPDIFREDRPRINQPDPNRTPRPFLPDTDEEELEEEDELFQAVFGGGGEAFPDLFSVIEGETQASDQDTFTGFEDRVNKEIDNQIDKLL